MGANTLIVNPKNGTTSFGDLPSMTLKRGMVIPAGTIILKEGAIWKERTGGYGGYGAKHIWQDHSLELARLGYSTVNDVARFVSDIITPGSEIFFEDNKNKSNRVNVLRSALGIVILEYKIQHQTSTHSVISAYTRRSSRGILVHTL